MILALVGIKKNPLCISKQSVAEIEKNRLQRRHCSISKTDTSRRPEVIRCTFKKIPSTIRRKAVSERWNISFSKSFFLYFQRVSFSKFWARRQTSNDFEHVFFDHPKNTDVPFSSSKIPQNRPMQPSLHRPITLPIHTSRKTT